MEGFTADAGRWLDGRGRAYTEVTGRLATVAAPAIATWSGGASTAWNTAANWSGGAVPTAGELASTDMGRAVAGLAASSADIGRAIAAPPGVPADRLAALQKAFSAMLADAAFRAEAARINADINPASGQELAAVAEATLRTPEAAVREAAEVLGGDAVPTAK